MFDCDTVLQWNLGKLDDKILNIAWNFFELLNSKNQFLVVFNFKPFFLQVVLIAFLSFENVLHIFQKIFFALLLQKPNTWKQQASNLQRVHCISNFINV